MITTGTNYFVSVWAATNYYVAYGHDAEDVLRKIEDGEIHIGKPALKPGERLSIIDNGRYAITS